MRITNYDDCEVIYEYLKSTQLTMDFIENHVSNWLPSHELFEMMDDYVKDNDLEYLFNDNGM